MKIAIYVRVSTADQHVESQLYDPRELASRRSFEVAKVYQDVESSPRKDKMMSFRKPNPAAKATA